MRRWRRCRYEWEERRKRHGETHVGGEDEVASVPIYVTGSV
jgi:hypothetical protein